MNKFFGTDKLLNTSIFMTVLLAILDMFGKVLSNLYTEFVLNLFMVICTIFLFVAYKKHNKNIQKGLLGVVLCWDLYNEMDYFCETVFNGNFSSLWNIASGRTWFIINVIMRTLYLIYFINYFLIVGKHSSSPKKILVNQIICIVISIAAILSLIAQMFVLQGNAYLLFESVAWHLFFIAYIFMLTSYQTHFEVWREKREQLN